jgi:hypothetical protein
MNKAISLAAALAITFAAGVATACPYYLKIKNNNANTVTVTKVETRIGGLSWKKKWSGSHNVKSGKSWSEEYKTTSLCNTTKHDFQVHYTLSNNNKKSQKKTGVKVQRGSTYTISVK